MNTMVETIPKNLFELASKDKMKYQNTETKKAMDQEIKNILPDGISLDENTAHLVVSFANLMRRERRVHPDKIIRTVAALVEAAYSQGFRKGLSGE